MTAEDFKQLAAVMRPKMLEEIRKYRPQAHGRLTEADEEEIVNDTIASLYRRMADLPDDDENLWKRFMSRLHGRFIDFLRKCGPMMVSLDTRPFPDGLTLGERIPSTKYSPDHVLEQGAKENSLLRLVQLLKDVPMLPRYRRVVNLAYLDSPATTLAQTGAEVVDGVVKQIQESEGLEYEAAKKLLQRARAALKKAVLSHLRDTKDPLIHLVEDNDFLSDQTGVL